MAVLDRRVGSLAGDFTPIGVILHHTASGLSMDPMPSLWTCQHAPPAPRCNWLVGRDGSCAAITDGKAADSGYGDPDVLAAIRAGRPLPAPDDTSTHRVSMNPWFYDVEIENNGLGEPYSTRVEAVVGRLVAAVLRHHGWGLDRVFLHKSLTRRKIDPLGTLDHWRGIVRPYVHDQEETIVAIGRDQLDDRRATVRLLFRTFLLRRPGTVQVDGRPVDEEDMHVYALAAEGYEARVEVFERTREGLVRLNEERAQAGLPPVA